MLEEYVRLSVQWGDMVLRRKYMHAPILLAQTYRHIYSISPKWGGLSRQPILQRKEPITDLYIPPQNVARAVWVTGLCAYHGAFD